jgi:hypothetical protein
MEKWLMNTNKIKRTVSICYINDTENIAARTNDVEIAVKTNGQAIRGLTTLIHASG